MHSDYLLNKPKNRPWLRAYDFFWSFFKMTSFLNLFKLCFFPAFSYLSSFLSFLYLFLAFPIPYFSYSILFLFYTLPIPYFPYSLLSLILTFTSLLFCPFPVPFLSLSLFHFLYYFFSILKHFLTCSKPLWCDLMQSYQFMSDMT